MKRKYQSEPVTHFEETADVKWCHEIIHEVSRTYAIVVDLLDEPLSTYTTIAYLMCRIADTIEDSPSLTSDQKTALLDQYRSTIRSTDPEKGHEFVSTAVDERPNDPLESSHWRLVVQADRVLNIYWSIPEPIRNRIGPAVDELTYGMRQYCGRSAPRSGIRIRTLPDLRRYCYFVAGTVSHFITDVFAATTKGGEPSELRSWGETYGIFLQLMNVTGSTHYDYHFVGNVFVPESLLEQYGVNQGALLQERNRNGTERALEGVIEEAQRYVPEARKYPERLSAGNKTVFGAWTFPYLLAIATLRELETNVGVTLEPRGVVIDPAEVNAIAEAVENADPNEIESLESTVREQPCHEALERE
jgi:farnesyl-diphosphate farnesyltransferase